LFNLTLILKQQEFYAENEINVIALYCRNCSYVWLCRWKSL